jgi:hypothetical protein
MDRSVSRRRGVKKTERCLKGISGWMMIFWCPRDSKFVNQPHCAGTDEKVQWRCTQDDVQNTFAS